MPSPRDRRYAESHEWFQAEGTTVTVGITQYAADELTDITYVEMKPPGTTVRAGESIGELESVKATSDIYTAVAGEIIEVNSAVVDDPSLVNSDPFSAGWLARIRIADTAALDGLMDQETYDQKHAVG